MDQDATNAVNEAAIEEVPSEAVVPKAAEKAPKGHKWQKFKDGWRKDFKKYGVSYLLFLPVLAWLIVFHYIPMVGLILAFKDSSVYDGIFGSPWIGWANFRVLFTGGGTGTLDFLYALRNTLAIGGLNLTIGYIVPIIFALIMSQITVKKFKRVCQMISYLPNFVSAVVIVQLMQNFIGEDGPLTLLCCNLFGTENIDWTNNNSPAIWFWYILFIVWQGFGYGSITYASAISNIDGDLYEAASIDGANRWHMMWKITLPNILPMILMLWILQIGVVFKVGFDKTQLLYNPATNAEHIDTLFSYTMRNTQNGDLGIATASSLFQSIVGTILLLGGNYLSKKTAKVSMF